MTPLIRAIVSAACTLSIMEIQPSASCNFGERCYALPTPLWDTVLSFLCGERPVIRYTVDPSVIERIGGEHDLAIGNGGRLITRIRQKSKQR